MRQKLLLKTMHHFQKHNNKLKKKAVKGLKMGYHILRRKRRIYNDIRVAQQLIRSGWTRLTMSKWTQPGPQNPRKPSEKWHLSDNKTIMKKKSKCKKSNQFIQFIIKQSIITHYLYNQAISPNSNCRKIKISRLQLQLNSTKQKWR